MNGRGGQSTTKLELDIIPDPSSLCMGKTQITQELASDLVGSGWRVHPGSRQVSERRRPMQNLVSGTW